MWDEDIYAKRPFILVNDNGYYFDEYNSKLSEPIIKNPTYEELLKTEITNQIFILNITQEKELKYLSSYLPVFKTPVYMLRIIRQFITGATKYNEKEVLALAEKDNRYTWLTLFVYGRLFRKCNLNPSYLFCTKPVHKIWSAYDLSKVNSVKVKKYLDSNEEFNHVLFLELAFADLMGETAESKAVEMILENREIAKADISQRLYISLMEEGMVYESEGKLVRI